MAVMCVNIPACIKVNNRPPVEPAGLPLHSDRVAVPLASSRPEACPLSRKKRPTAVLRLGRHQQSKRIEYPEFRHLVPRHLSCLPLSDIAPDNTTGVEHRYRIASALAYPNPENRIRQFVKPTVPGLKPFFPDMDCFIRVSSRQVFLYIPFGIRSPVFIAACKRQSQQAGHPNNKYFFNHLQIFSYLPTD